MCWAMSGSQVLSGNIVLPQYSMKDRLTPSGLLTWRSPKAEAICTKGAC